MATSLDGLNSNDAEEDARAKSVVWLPPSAVRYAGLSELRALGSPMSACQTEMMDIATLRCGFIHLLAALAVAGRVREWARISAPSN